MSVQSVLFVHLAFLYGPSPHDPGSLCGAGSPCGPQCRRSALHPGDFLPDEKVTKESPRAAPFGIPQCGVTALAALANASRRATFSHKNRPICHFEMGGKSVFLFSSTFCEEIFSAVNPWHGRIVPEDAAGLFTRNQCR